MIGLTFEFFLSYSILGRSIRGYFAQQRKTHFQCGNKYSDDGYAHIVAITMSDDVLNI